MAFVRFTRPLTTKKMKKITSPTLHNEVLITVINEVPGINDGDTLLALGQNEAPAFNALFQRARGTFVDVSLTGRKDKVGLLFDPEHETTDWHALDNVRDYSMQEPHVTTVDEASEVFREQFPLTTSKFWTRN